MRRLATTTVTVLVTSLALTSCGTSDYCAAVEKHEESLNTYGSDKTNEAYTASVAMFREIAKVAPEKVTEDWTALADVTQGVLDAQEEVGVSLEDLTNPEQVAGLDGDDVKTLNEAYAAYNDSVEQRESVVDNVKEECEITLR